MATNPGMKPQGYPLEGTAGHEVTDARVGGVFAAVAFLVVAGICVHLALGRFLQQLDKQPPPNFKHGL